MSPQTNPVPEVLIVTFSIAFCWLPIFIGLKLYHVCKDRLREWHARKHPEPEKPPPPRPPSALLKGKGVDLAGLNGPPGLDTGDDTPRAPRAGLPLGSHPAMRDWEIERGLPAATSPSAERFEIPEYGQSESYRTREGGARLPNPAATGPIGSERRYSGALALDMRRFDVNGGISPPTARAEDLKGKKKAPPGMAMVGLPLRRKTEEHSK